MGILDSFTVRLKKLDETIVPVYQQTKRLTQLQESIQPSVERGRREREWFLRHGTDVDKTLVQLDKVIGYHHVSDDVETQVQDGPSGDVEAYVKVRVHLPYRRFA